MSNIYKFPVIEKNHTDWPMDMLMLQIQYDIWTYLRRIQILFYLEYENAIKIMMQYYGDEIVKHSLHELSNNLAIAQKKISERKDIRKRDREILFYSSNIAFLLTRFICTEGVIPEELELIQKLLTTIVDLNKVSKVYPVMNERSVVKQMNRIKLLQNMRGKKSSDLWKYIGKYNFEADEYYDKMAIKALSYIDIE